MDEDMYSNPLIQDSTGHSSNAIGSIKNENNTSQPEDIYATIDLDDEKGQQASSTKESQSNMEFAIVQSHGTTDQVECIYAVVSKGSKTPFSTQISSEKMKYSKMGLNDSIREKSAFPSSGPQDLYSSSDNISTQHKYVNKKNTDYDTINENSDCMKSDTKIDGISHRYKFPAVFLGSMVVDLKNLEKNKTEYLLNCIQSVAAQNSEATSMTLQRFNRCSVINDAKHKNGGRGDVTLSTHRGMNVVIVLEGGHVKVREKKSNSIRLDIPLTNIRMWGTGKGSSSREFAIISKDLSLKAELCRVFLCEVLARTVASIFEDICSQLSKLEEVKSQSSKVDNQSLSDSDILKKTASVANFKSSSTVRSNKSEGSKPNNSLRDLTTCYYLGMMEVEKSTGTKVIERATDMVHSYVSDEFWQLGKLLTTPDGLYFINDGNLGLSCPNSSLTFIGPSIKHKNLVGIIVRKNNGIFAHIFSIETDLFSWFENMKFICKLHSSKFDKTSSTTLDKRSKFKKS